MDISAAAMVTAALQMQQSQTIQQGQVAVLKKAMEISEASAVQLIQSIPQQPALATSGSLGTRINTFV
ncbi:MAG TPA: putative motility protein [Limnobacter sp.]|nr:putative motility protein [Limnobacter sp.]